MQNADWDAEGPAYVQDMISFSILQVFLRMELNSNALNGNNMLLKAWYLEEDDSRQELY